MWENVHCILVEAQLRICTNEMLNTSTACMFEEMQATCSCARLSQQWSFWHQPDYANCRHFANEPGLELSAATFSFQWPA